MKRGEVGIIIERGHIYKGTIFIISKENFAQIIGKQDGWSQVSNITLEVINITEHILEGVKNATNENSI
jgi:hypothetical protein